MMNVMNTAVKTMNAAVRTMGSRSYSDSTKWTHLISNFESTIPSDSNEKISENVSPHIEPGVTTYEPSDFSLSKHKFKATERGIAQLRGEGKKDAFKELGVNPLELWKSPIILSQYITSNGKIIPGFILGNKGPSQRKLAKAIRRCRAAGLLSTTHKSVF